MNPETLTPPELSGEEKVEKVREIFKRLIEKVEMEIDNSHVRDPRHKEMVSDLLRRLKEQQTNLEQGLENVDPHAAFHALRKLAGDPQYDDDLATLRRIFSSTRD